MQDLQGQGKTKGLSSGQPLCSDGPSGPEIDLLLRACFSLVQQRCCISQHRGAAACCYLAFAALPDSGAALTGSGTSLAAPLDASSAAEAAAAVATAAL